MKGFNIEAFYTGGGIWLCGCHITEKDYYIVDSDFEDCITLYNDGGTDGEKYPCEKMVASWDVDSIKNFPVYTLYRLMINELHREMGGAIWYKYKVSWTTPQGERVTDQTYDADTISELLVQLENDGCIDIRIESTEVMA